MSDEPNNNIKSEKTKRTPPIKRLDNTQLSDPSHSSENNRNVSDYSDPIVLQPKPKRRSTFRKNTTNSEVDNIINSVVAASSQLTDSPTSDSNTETKPPLDSTSDTTSVVDEVFAPIYKDLKDVVLKAPGWKTDDLSLVVADFFTKKNPLTNNSHLNTQPNPNLDCSLTFNSPPPRNNPFSIFTHPNYSNNNSRENSSNNHLVMP